MEKKLYLVLWSGKYCLIWKEEIVDDQAEGQKLIGEIPLSAEETSFVKGLDFLTSATGHTPFFPLTGHIDEIITKCIQLVQKQS